MKVKAVIRYFDRELGRTLEAGEVNDMPVGRAEMLISRGFVEEVKEDTTKKKKALI